MFEKSIFIFRRDFRLYDNIGLIELMKLSHKVIPVFIFTPEQIVNNQHLNFPQNLNYLKQIS